MISLVWKQGRFSQTQIQEIFNDLNTLLYEQLGRKGTVDRVLLFVFRFVVTIGQVLQNISLAELKREIGEQMGFLE
jgi:hypothetical protein